MNNETHPTELNFRIKEPLGRAIAARAPRHGGPNYAARAALERYYYLLDVELRGLRGRFSPGELSLLADLVNGWYIDPPSIGSLGLLALEVQDGIDLERLDKKWGVDPEQLMDKIRSLSYAQSAALLDALDRWWGQQPSESPTDFTSVGLVPAPENNVGTSAAEE